LRLRRLDVRDGFAFPSAWLSFSSGCAAFERCKIFAPMQKPFAERKNGSDIVSYTDVML